MIRGFWTVIVAGISMLLVYAYQNEGLPESVLSQQKDISQLDLSQWEFDQQTVLAIDQNWRFYPNQLIDAAQLKQNNTAFQPIQSPHIFAHSRFDQTGQANYGSYVLPMTFSSTQTKQLALYLPRSCNSSRIYFQSLSPGQDQSAKPLAELGNFSTSERFQGYSRESSIVSLGVPNGRQYAMIIQVGSAYNAEIGLCETPFIGTPQAIHNKQHSMLLYDGATIAIIFCFGLFSLATSISGSRNRSYIWLGGLALTSVLMLWSEQNLWQDSLGASPDWNQQLSQDAFLSFWLLVGPLLLGFIHHSFKQHFISTRYINLNLRISLAAVAFVIISPSSLYLPFSPNAVFYAVAQTLAAIALVGWAKLKRLEYSGRLLINVAPLLIALLFLFLNHFGVVKGPRQLQASLVFLMMSQGLLQSQKLARASRIAARLSIGLSDAVKQQTAALHYKNQQLLNIQAKLTQANQELQTLSITDGLTGIHNRMYFDRQFVIEWQRSRREQESLSLLLLDIDYFKKLNDHYGHSAGDAALKQISQLLLKTFKRGGDFVCRYGGEEFVILLSNTHEEQALEMASHICKTVAASQFSYQHQPLRITASIGVAGVVPNSSHSSLELLNTADKALYLAKRSGRNQVAAANTPPLRHVEPLSQQQIG